MRSGVSESTRSRSWKYSMRMGFRPPRTSCALRGHQIVDSCAKIPKHEILIGRRLAVVHFLGPLLDRKFDTECLVDRESNVEEIEAVDVEVVHRMALGFDFGWRNIAS